MYALMYFVSAITETGGQIKVQYRLSIGAVISRSQSSLISEFQIVHTGHFRGGCPHRETVLK